MGFNSAFKGLKVNVTPPTKGVSDTINALILKDTISEQFCHLPSSKTPPFSI
jgi:hypothetical protein